MRSEKSSFDTEVYAVIAQANMPDCAERPVIHLLYIRWMELLWSDFDLSRRARTLSPRTSLLEVIDLARLWIKRAGNTAPSEPAKEAGHGIATLPDVAQECRSLLLSDPIIKLIPDILTKQAERALRIFNTLEEVKEPLIVQLEALASYLDANYVGAGLKRLREICLTDSGQRIEAAAIAEVLATDLVRKGWTSETLREIAKQCLLNYSDTASFIDSFIAKVTSTHLPMQVHCPLSREIQLPAGIEMEDFRFTVFEDRPVIVHLGRWLDARQAAIDGFERCSSVVGSIDVFSDNPVNLKSTEVIVTTEAGSSACIQCHDELRRSKRGKQDDAIRIALKNVTEMGKSNVGSPLAEAIRHYQRAASTWDSESKFLLLWFGIERLFQGGRYEKHLLEGMRYSIPRCITIARMRREFGMISAAVGHCPLSDDAKKEIHNQFGFGPFRQPLGVDRRKLYSVIVGPESEYRDLIKHFITVDPRLAHWCLKLRKQLHRQSDKSHQASVREYFEHSRQRVEWQVLRLYRARNHIAHAGRGPSWVRELTHHAHYYLNQLMAIIATSDERDNRQPCDILYYRAACYDAFISMIEDGSIVNDPDTLMSPMNLFRTKLT